MGYFAEYLDMGLDFDSLNKLRKEQLKLISDLRGREVLVYAADLNKGQAPISISYEDLTPINDQLSNLGDGNLDFIIETPGGAGEIAESIVRSLHAQFNEIGVIIPGCAMSAGTIIAMSGDEIMMHRQQSSLGPIDAQLIQNGKQFSAHAFLEGIEKIKDESKGAAGLSRAYIPILQTISPGEIEHAKNAQEFSRKLVTTWLAKYKFRNWTTHSTSGTPVTDEDKRNRAKEIAAALCDHSHWKTHGRRINLDDLDRLRLKITDYSNGMPDLSEAIERYYVLLQMTFSTTSIYKLYETPTSQIIKHHIAGQNQVPASKQENQAMCAEVAVPCQCGVESKIQANLDAEQPIQNGRVPFPKDDQFVCPNCGQRHNLSNARMQLEAQTGKKVIR